MFGKLTAAAFKHDAIQTGGVVMMLLSGAIAMGYLFYTKRWKWLWDEWLTTLDPKKIGVMYLLMVFLMLLKGVIDGALMRAQQIVSVGDAQGIFSADHFQQVFTAHGTTMIFFVGMGIVFGLMNLIIPLQIGARDVAYPFLNSLGFWLFFAAIMLLNVSLAIGDFSIAGWVGYAPLSGLEFGPGEGIDYWIWTLQIAGVGSLISGINFIVTILKMRCPGMTMMKMPMFVWSVLATLVLIIFAFPILTATLSLLALDRYMDMHFFTSSFGGDQMMYVNLFWAWGHPEVYILVLPAFGIFSEVVATYSRKKLFGYTSMVWAIVAITVLSFLVWLHHFFTMGADANVNAFFGIMTMLIAVPTGVKVFNWLFTMHQGRILFATPMLWFMGFIAVFTIGGMTGVLMAVPAIDFQVHNSLFLVAHFHSVIIGGVVFGFFAGFTYWFPKFTGIKLDEKLGKYAFVCWFIGFMAAFLPLYALGLMGATRRLDHYEASTGWQPLFIVAGFGVFLILCGIGFQILQLIKSIKQKDRDTTGDPWNGRTLEWSTTSPPPLYNFARLPKVTELDEFWVMKQTPVKHKEEVHHFEMPKNSAAGLIISAFSFIFSFAMVWHIFWLAGVGLLGVIISLIIRLSNDDFEYELEVKG